jgi:hypothetical protein
MRMLVAGLAGSGIPSTALTEGKVATITGIVKRPYPTASDRRCAVVPRSIGDIVLGTAVASSMPPATSRTSNGDAPGSSPSSSGADRPVSGNGDAGAAPPDVELVELVAHVGAIVHVGGLVTEVGADGFELDDGTSTARVVLEGDAAQLAGLVEPGDAVNATGIADRRDGPVLVVTDLAGLVLLGDLGAAAAGDPAGPAAAARDGTSVGPDTPGMDRIDTALAAAGSPDPALLAAATVILTAALGVVLTARLRYRSVLRDRRRIAVRLARIGGGSDRP